MRARGRCGGRPKVRTADTRVVLAKKLHADMKDSLKNNFGNLFSLTQPLPEGEEF